MIYRAGSTTCKSCWDFWAERNICFNPFRASTSEGYSSTTAESQACTLYSEAPDYIVNRQKSKEES